MHASRESRMPRGEWIGVGKQHWIIRSGSNRSQNPLTVHRDTMVLSVKSQCHGTPWVIDSGEIGQTATESSEECEVITLS